MKNLIVLFIVVLTACSSNEDKTKFILQNNSSFCIVQRELKNRIDNKNGELVYLESEEKYAFKYIHPNTIDEVTYYFICQKPKNIDLHNQLIFSGFVYKFNNDEGFAPPLGGVEYLYLKVISIEKI